MSLLVFSNDLCLEHLVRDGHPEQPTRLTAVKDGLSLSGVLEAATLIETQQASLESITRTHSDQQLNVIQDLVRDGGGPLDEDTNVSAMSLEAARHAAGAGLMAIDRMASSSSAADSFCVVRPPGHHATDTTSMGFCLFNNVAVCAHALADVGERVVIVDIDAHHGNGTQDIFYNDDRVLFISIHQWPLYPGTGRVEETGGVDAVGTNINIAVPKGTTGDVYLSAWDRIAAPIIDDFKPTWLLVSAGFDAHRSDPITQLGLSSGDYFNLMERMKQVVERGRRIVFLEGGYNLDALRDSSAALLSSLLDTKGETGFRCEASTNDSVGMSNVDTAVEFFKSQSLIP